MRRCRHGHRPRASLAATLLLAIGALACTAAASAEDATSGQGDPVEDLDGDGEATDLPRDPQGAADVAADAARAAESGDGAATQVPPSERVTIGDVRIRGVRAALEENVRARLSLIQDPPEPLTDARLSYLLRQAPAEILEALEPFGYYDAKVAIETARRGAVVDLAIAIQRGPPVRVRVQDIALEGAGGEDPALAAEQRDFRPAVGQVLDHRVYAESKGEIQRLLLGRGYFDAEPGTQRVSVHRAERAADIELAWRTGPRYVYGETTFVDSHIDERVLRRYLPYRPGEPFRQEDLVALHQALASLEYFGLVDIQPQPQAGGVGVAPIEVGLTAAKRTAYRVGLSYGTDYGAAIEAGMERRYVNRAGHKLDVDLALGQRRTLAGVVYRVPTLSGPIGWWTAGLTVREEEFGDFGPTQRAELVVGRNGEWEGFTFSAEAHVLKERFELGGVSRDSTLVFPQFHVEWSEGDHPLYPRRGLGWSATARAGHSAIGSDADFAQVLANITWIHPVGERNRLIVRGSAGGTWTDEFDALPPSLRFFAGGDRSVRGYGFREIGPRDAEGRVLGGKHLLVGSVEYEHMFNDSWGMAAFVDAGDAFTSTEFDARIGVGAGVRWRSPVGPVRVDVGVGLDDPDRAVRLHLTIGPEL